MGLIVGSKVFLVIMLPALILLLENLLKLYVDRSPTISDLVNTALALPISINSLSLGLLAIHATANPSHNAAALSLTIFLLLVVAIATTVLWRRARASYAEGSFSLVILLSLLAYGSSAYGLLYAVTLLTSM